MNSPGEIERPRVHKMWKRTEEHQLVALYRKRTRVKTIAKLMGRTPDSVASKVFYLERRGELTRWFRREVAR